MKNSPMKQQGIAILGFGQEGQSLLRYLTKKPSPENRELWILDQNPAVRKSVPRKFRSRIHWRLGWKALERLQEFAVVFRSPGVPYRLPQLDRAREKGVVLSSATKLFFAEMRRIQKARRGLPKLVGVTGTKGKGTTATLLSHMLRLGGEKTILAGNIGNPMLDTLAKAARADYVILELSSFQLQDLTDSPEIAVVLDVFPDHLDAHRTLHEYYTAKKNIGRFQKRSDILFYFANSAGSRRIAAASPARKMAVQPRHNTLQKNYEMATAVARRLGVPKQSIERAIARFHGLEHRMEFVREVDHIRFYNDSAGTNPIATIAAIRSFHEPIILIAGGKNKGFDYRPLGKALRASTVKTVMLFGENKRMIARTIKNTPVVLSRNLRETVRTAYARAQKMRNVQTEKMILILLSPASASFDQFKNYVDRGKQFKEIVLHLR